MIKIEKDRLSIIINNISPAEYTSDLMKSLTGIIMHQSDDFRIINAQHTDAVLRLLQELLPDCKQIIEFYGKENNTFPDEKTSSDAQ